MNRVAIFPYDYEFEHFIDFQLMRDDFQIVKIFSMKGWGYVGRQLEGVEGLSWIVKDIDSFYLDNSFDICMIINSEHILESTILLSVIKQMAEAGKDIYVLRKLTEYERNDAKTICNDYGVKIKFLIDDLSCSNIDDETEILYEIGTPIVVICGLGDRSEKCELQMNLVKKLKKDGYNTVWISNHEESILYGGEVMPWFMIDDALSEKRKILAFNHYLKAIDLSKKPDLIIIAVPGGIMPYSKKQVGYFGIMAYFILNSINPDYMIMSLYYSNIDLKYLGEMNNLIKYKFNADVDCYYLCNNAQDAYSLDKESPVEYIGIDDLMINEKLKELHGFEVPIFGRTDISLLYSHMIERLSEFDEYKVL